MILNNYRLFFAGGLSNLIEESKVESILADFKVVTGESAFVVRTFFFIIFGWSVSVGSMFNIKTIAVGIVLILGIGTLFKGGETSKKYSNKLMQLRVLLQFIAIIALVGFAYFFKN